MLLDMRTSLLISTNITVFGRYRITEGVNLPFRVLPTIKELGRTRMEVNVKVCYLMPNMLHVSIPLCCY